MRLSPGLSGQPRTCRAGVASGHAGYAMVALLVALSIMAVMLSVALPAWRTLAQRERETELVFRAQQYARAIALFQRKYANAFPPTLDILVEQKFLRKKYLDPVTGGEFQPLYVGQGQGPGPNQAGPAGQQGRAGIMGVTSKSTARSLREFNGRTKYNEWAFVPVPATTRAGAPNAGPTPGGGAGGVGGPGAGRVGQPGDGRGRPGGANLPLGGGPRPGGRP